MNRFPSTGSLLGWPFPLPQLSLDLLSLLLTDSFVWLNFLIPQLSLDLLSLPGGAPELRLWSAERPHLYLLLLALVEAEDGGGGAGKEALEWEACQVCCGVPDTVMTVACLLLFVRYLLQVLDLGALLAELVCARIYCHGLVQHCQQF
jgi:hypothetical protein